jgi:hypothetical protein
MKECLAQGLCRLAIDDRLEIRRLLDWQVGGSRAFQDSIHEDCTFAWARKRGLQVFGILDAGKVKLDFELLGRGLEYLLRVYVYRIGWIPQHAHAGSCCNDLLQHVRIFSSKV